MNTARRSASRPGATGFVLLAVLLAAPSMSWGFPEGTRAEIEALLSAKQPIVRGVALIDADLVRTIYADNGFVPYWGSVDNIAELSQLIDNAADHGLSPRDYGGDAIADALARRKTGNMASPRVVAEEDVLLTVSLLRYGYHRRFGKIRAAEVEPTANFRRQPFSTEPLSVVLRRALAAPTLEGFITQIAPEGPYYRRLQDWLDHYRDLAADGGWPTVPDGPTLRAGDTDPRVGSMRRRLAAGGHPLESVPTDGNLFDEDLASAVRRFQDRHGLDGDGIVGKQTLAAMNVSIYDRIDQLRLSLERLRWVNQEASATVVVVNIAGFRVYFLRDGDIEWETRAMVGKAYRETPVFRGELAYMEFNPTWTIPPTILRNDTLPAIKRDPNYLASKNIRVIDADGRFVDPATVDWSQYTRGVPYTLRQEPGPDNALGTVKFIFPNEHFVFLHDTPNRELFDRADRAFSSGCIRVEDPYRLAELLMDDAEHYPRSRFESIVATRETQRVTVPGSVPVLLIYLTAGIEDGGEVTFYRDIYGRDRRLLDALNGPVSISLPDRD